MKGKDDHLNLTDLERFYLARLRRFARIAAETEAQQIPDLRRLAQHALFSAYLDCLALGLHARAKRWRRYGEKKRAASLQL